MQDILENQLFILRARIIIIYEKIHDQQILNQVKSDAGIV